MQTTKTSFALIFAIWAAGLGAAAQFAKIAVVFPTVVATYPEAGHWIGFSLSLVGFIGILLGVIAGLIVSQLRSKPVLLSALLLGALMSLYQATLPPLPLFLLSRVLEGLSHLAIVVIAPTLIAQLSEQQHRGFTMTLWGTFFGIAFALTALLGVPLVESRGLPALFIAHAAYLLFITALLWVAMPDFPNTSKIKPDFSPRHLLSQHVLIYRSPQKAAPAIGWLFYTLTFVALLTVLPSFIEESQRTLVISAMPLASIAVSMTLGVLLLRFMPAFRCVQLGLLLALTVVASLYLLSPSAAICITLAGALGLVQGASFAAVPQLNDSREAQAHANGAMAQMGNLGTTLGTPILLLMSNQWAIAGLVLFASVLYLLGTASHQLMHRQRTRQESN